MLEAIRKIPDKKMGYRLEVSTRWIPKISEICFNTDSFSRKIYLIFSIWSLKYVILSHLNDIYLSKLWSSQLWTQYEIM